MPRGIPITFDLERFKRPPDDDYAIGIICYNNEELKLACEYIKQVWPSWANELPVWSSLRDAPSYDDLWARADEWTSIFCSTYRNKEGRDIPFIDIVSDYECDGDVYYSDYNFCDIIWPSFINIEENDVMSILIEE